VLALLIGVGLRMGMLAQDVRLHPDEALYATFARRISLHGDLLLADAPLDKPPLAFLAIAGSFTALGVGEFAARLPGLFSSILSLAVIYGLAQRLYADRRVALLAMILLALSPLDLAFDATAFVDPLLTLLLLVACLFASRDQWLEAGIAFALAIATKQSALAFAPPIILLGVACTARSGWRWRKLLRRSVLRRSIAFVLPVVICGAILVAWSNARAAPVDFWTLNAINNNPGRFIRANEVVPRIERWSYLLSNVTGFAPLLALAAVPVIPLFSRVRRRDVLADAVLAITILAALLGYWLIAFNTYDRYVHPLGPLILLLVARGATRFGTVLPWLMVLCMLPFPLTALRGQLDVGGDQGHDTGIDQLAKTLNALPPDAVVYEYSLDWELDFYLGDQTRVHLIFEPSPQGLTRTVCASDQPVYFAASVNGVSPWFLPLRERGARITELTSGPMRLYALSCTF
jgi:4-amino-4-deoxy-L-arabinose transferase-like glycosyltransferase